MKSSDRAILLVIPLIAALIGVWVLLISPKRSEEGKLNDQVTSLRAQADQADQQVAQSELARKSFDENYAALVDLGAAAPADADQSSLVYSLAHMANENDLRFSGFTLSESPAGAEPGAATTPAPAATTSTTESTTTTTPTESGSTTTPTDTSGTTSSTSTTTATATATAAPATEAAAATLPLGAAVGPAGLPVSSYAFSLNGRYFDAADFLAGIDSLVEASPTKEPSVHGRLLTIDAFSLSLDDLANYPMIDANLSVTTYEVPADQGVEAGATAAGPAPAGTTTDPTATATSAPTASVSP